MATDPNKEAIRDVSDYLFSVDPSGQFMYGYSWDHCGTRPDDIFDIHGSGQCTTGGAFKLYAKEFVETARIPVIRHPIHLAGPGYDIFGNSFGLIPSSGHRVFKDNTPVIDWQNGNMSGYRSAPIDFRYDNERNVYSMPYNVFLAKVTAVAAIGFAYSTNGTLNNTLPIKNYYSVASGMYRYRATPYAIDAIELPNYPSFNLNNVAEFNNDLAYFGSGDYVMVMKNPQIIASGSYLCNERPLSFSAFL